MKSSAVAVVTVVVALALASSTVRGGAARADEPAPGRAAGRVDHSAFTALLREHVDERGLVDYAAWNGRGVPALDAYIATLQAVDPAALADDHERTAFWINAYNAWTIRFIISKWPTASIRDHTARFWGFNVWNDHPLEVSGKDYTLSEIEHEILRPMGEPLIHFGLNCASMGCPRLRREAYEGERIIDQLTDDIQVFLADPTKLRIDRAERTVHVSRIFSWFQADFGGSDRAVLDWIRVHAKDEAIASYLARSDLEVEYLDYDWSINAPKK